MVNSDKGFSGLIPFRQETNWKDVWEKAKKVQEGFKGISYPNRDQQNEAWQRFQSLRDEASKKAEDERNERRKNLERHRSEILHQVESARPNSLFGFDPINVENMKSYGKVLREAGQILSESKREMLGEHKQECFDAIQIMRDIHDAWWSDLKRERAKRHREFQERIRRNLEQNHERHRKATQALQHFQSKASDLRSQIASAWNDDWASRASGGFRS